jgi:uncharacterized membrane protein YebE (DUF533 family)
MIDATRLLDLLVGGNAQPDAPPPPAQHAPPTQYALARDGGSEQQQAEILGEDLFARAKELLGGATNGLGGGLGGGLAGGVAAGAITSLLLGHKGSRAFAGEALKLGAAAALGGLAYRAYANYRDNNPVGATGASASVPSAPPSPLPAATPANEHALVLVRAMIAAALADGTLDITERSSIMSRLGALGINSDERRFLDAELAQPWSPAQFAAAAPNPEQRSEIYLASALAIDADTQVERSYLAYLATGLALDDKLVAHLDDGVSAAKSDGTPAAARPASAPRQLSAG